MNFKRLTAFAVVATMVIGNCVTAFATDTTSTGSGIVEYDDSTDVEYDSVTVPTLVTDSTYAFKIDPTGLLEEYGIKSDYENATVFFHKVKTQAKVEAAAENGHLYKEKYTEVTPTSNNYTGIATCTVEDDGTYTFSAVKDGYYLWVPDTAYQTGGVNKSGKYQAITKEDAAVYFDIPADNTITFRDDYKAGASPCNGKIYKREGEQADPITASYSEPITKWVTLSDQNAVTAVTGLWTDADLTTAAGVDDVKYTKAVYTYNSSTDEAYFINKSTKQKDITVKVTLENATGLTINNSTTFADDDNSASVYFAAMNGSTAVPLAVSNDVVSATFTATLAGATDDGETLYQTTSYNAAGGHKYGRFTGPAPTYTNHSFSIEAAANDNAGAVEAWKTYGATVTADTKPQLKVVYTYADHSDTPAPITGYVEFDNQYTFWFGLSSTEGFATSPTITSLTIDGHDVTEAVSMKTYNETYWPTVTWSAATAAGVEDKSTGTYTCVLTTDTNTYNFTLSMD